MTAQALGYPRRVSASEIEQQLGPFDSLTAIGEQSGSGECWRASTGRDEYVLKIVVHEHEPGRFDREVDALQRLSSTRVMRVDSRGTISTGGGTFPYLKSEFISGGSLRTHLASGGLPDDTAIREFLLEMLRGLDELGSVQVVHRDLKPENIILRNGDWTRPVIIDLGLSRLLDVTSFTVYPWAAGTWPYMSPEQLRGERATIRSDVWAAAVIAAEAATGSHPFWRGEMSPPPDWDARLRSGIALPGSRPAAFHDWIRRGSAYRAFQRPTAGASVATLEANW